MAPRIPETSLYCRQQRLHAPTDHHRSPTACASLPRGADGKIINDHDVVVKSLGATPCSAAEGGRGGLIRLLEVTSVETPSLVDLAPAERFAVVSHVEQDRNFHVVSNLLRLMDEAGQDPELLFVNGG